jgi:hypothetical protein
MLGCQIELAWDAKMLLLSLAFSLSLSLKHQFHHVLPFFLLYIRSPLSCFTLYITLPPLHMIPSLMFYPLHHSHSLSLLNYFTINRFLNHSPNLSIVFSSSFPPQTFKALPPPDIPLPQLLFYGRFPGPTLSLLI